MGVAETVRESQRLLERMTEKPEAVLAVLAPAERTRILEELRVLADRAGDVQNEVELLQVTDTVRRLVEETPGLSTLSLLAPDYTQLTSEQRSGEVQYHSFLIESPDSSPALEVSLGYRRCTDFDERNNPGQDFAAVRGGGGYVVGVVADGVRLANLASRFTVTWQPTIYPDCC